MDIYTNSYRVDSQTSEEVQDPYLDQLETEYGFGLDGFDPEHGEDFAFSEDAFIEGSGSAGGRGGVSEKIQQLRAALAQSPLKNSEKSEIENQLRALEGRLNQLASLSPQNQQIQLETIYAELGTIEMRVLGMGSDGELGMDEAGDPDDEYSPENLQATVKAVGEEIEDLYSDGKITEDLYNDLVSKHGRIESELDLKTGDPEQIAELVAELRGSLSGIRAQYVDTGEPVDTVDGEEDLSKYPETVNRLTTWLRANGSPDLKAKDLMDKAEQLGLTEDDLRYPSLPPSEKFMNFLLEVDPGLKHLMGEYQALLGVQAEADAAEEAAQEPEFHDPFGTTHDPYGLQAASERWQEDQKQAAQESDQAPARSAARDRIYGLLKAVFPDATIGNSVPSDSPAFNKSDDLIINEIKYDIFENESGTIRFAEWANADA